MVKKSGIEVVAVDFDLSKVSDEWIDLVAAAQVVWGAHERNRWLLGDIGLKFLGRYKEDAVAKFAHEVGSGLAASTMRDYIATAQEYNEYERAEFPSLSWSHYREAKGADTHQLALLWLGKAADNEWTVSQLAAAMEDNGNPDDAKPDQPVKLAEFSGEYMGSDVINPGTDGSNEGFLVTFRCVVPLLDIKPRVVYKLKAYGVRDDTAQED